jgi:HEAT repeat protein
VFHLGLTVARELPCEEVGEALATELARAPAERQPLLLTALADRGDPAGLPAILDAAQQGPKEMRVVAIRAIKKMQVASAAPALLDAATTEGAVGSAALDTLAALKGSEVDREIAERLKKAEGNSRAVLMRLAGQRRIVDAVPVLEKALDDPDKEIRAAALFALGQTIVPADLPKLIAVAMSPNSEEDAEAAIAALRAAATRMPDREATAERLTAAMQAAPIEGKILVLEILTDMGGPKALAAVAAAASSDSPELQDAGTRLLGQWMSPDAAEVTVELARTLKNEKYRNRVMKGCIRILRQFELPDEKRIALCGEAIKASRLAEEKILVCEVLHRTPTKATLDLAVSLLSDPEAKDAAAATAVGIASNVIEDDPDAVADAMKRVLAADPRSGKVQKAARSMLKDISEGKTP